MPRATFPPTPGSSTDMKGQDGSKLATLQISFELPPPAMMSNDTSSSNSANGAMKAPGPGAYPMQPSETVKSRRRTATTQNPAKDKDQFALPPPPTRSRKIIQMKPREETPQETQSNAKGAASASKTNTNTNTTSTATPPAAAGTKRKQPSATSAAGRKIARKTAHSLIERRRRSKMNEEFAVLKSMIPACTGEMHKLAILQASIEYVRYLEDCITKLKAQCGSDSGSKATDTGLPSPTRKEPYNPDRNYNMTDVGSPDVEMTSSGIPSPAFTNSAGRSNQPSVSPALLAEDMRDRHNSYSSISTEYRHHRYSVSSNTSPNFGPQGQGYPPSIHSASGSTLPSPALIPQRDFDQEATAALLMLNQAGRRHPNTATTTSGHTTAARGMSVRDLLTRIPTFAPAWVYQALQQSLNPRLCTFPSFPIGRSRESLQQSLSQATYSTPRTLPPLPRGPDLDLSSGNRQRRNSFKPPRLLPVNVSSQSSRTTANLQLSPSSFFPAPLFSTRSPPSRAVTTTTANRHKRVFSSSKPQPLRLVQETQKDKRKKQPPVFYAQHSHSVLQSLTYITIQQKTCVDDYNPDNNNNYFKMASNPVMPKVAPPAPSSSSNPTVTLPPLPSSTGGNNNVAAGPRATAPSFGAVHSKEELIADLRRQLSDTASDASSVDSRGRRRRRNNNNKALAQKGAVGGLAQPAVLPRLAETKPVRLQLGLNLDVEVELKARLQGDVSLTLL
ncbi:54fc86e1-e77c-48da-81be-2d7d2ab3e00e [Naviculisporaceae sp. PSN 640]